jgi:recombination protein RecT
MTDTHAVATVADKPPIIVLRERFEARKTELRHSLPPDISPDVFIRAIVTSAQINPEILACSWQSVWTACLRACRDGLLPDGIEGAIVPFKGTATWIPMYQGLLRRFRRSGQFKWINAGIVHDGETFEHWIDETGEHFKHVPGDNIDAPITKIYALATTKDGGVFVAVLTKAEADKIKNMSRTTREDAPWKIWPGEMYKKTALRRLSKMLPSARDLLGDEESLLDMVPAPSISPAAIAAPAPAEPPPAEPPPQQPQPREPEPERETGAAASLNQFAGTPAPASTGTEAPQQSPVADGEQAAGGPPDVASATPARAPVAITKDDIAAAYKRGQQARADNIQRRAVPGEFRGHAMTALAAAWVRGWDGEGTAP